MNESPLLELSALELGMLIKIEFIDFVLLSKCQDFGKNPTT